MPDAAVGGDRNAELCVACESASKTGMIMIFGEITISGYIGSMPWYTPSQYSVKATLLSTLPASLKHPVA